MHVYIVYKPSSVHITLCLTGTQPDVMEDLCDGEGFCEHPLFSVSTPNSLQIFFYYDDVEVCNPLQSSRLKHKLCELLSVCGIHNVLSRVCSQCYMYVSSGIANGRLDRHKPTLLFQHLMCWVLSLP